MAQRTYVEQWEHDPFEECCGLVQRPAHGLVVMYVQLTVIFVLARAFACEADVLSNGIEKNTF